MGDRLRPRDLELLAIDTPTSPMHNATLEVFDPGDSGFDYQALVGVIADRMAFVPRYRQRLATVPGWLANPLWVDDPDFDLGFHVRRSALPRPGNLDQLRELTARIVSRPLDRNRPLWEVYFIEGLADGRVAVLTKSHQILVDGVKTVDLGQVLLDDTAEPKDLGSDDWQARHRPTGTSLVLGALQDSLERPSTIFNTVVSNAATVQRLATAALSAPMPRRNHIESPINGDLCQQRRFVAVSTDLADYRTVRRVHGGTVNDVILATVTGALRNWLMTRDESLGGLKSLKAIVPMSVIDEELEATSLGSQVAGHDVLLPIGEPSPVVRLHQVTYNFHGHKETGRAVSARRLAGISGFAPTTFHALGSRVAAAEARRGFHLSVTNVPGPQFPLYAAGAQMLETYPVHPLLPGHALAIGVTSYDGRVFYGITGDRDLLPDLDILGDCIVEALEELKDSASPARKQAPRGRRTPKAAAKDAAKSAGPATPAPKKRAAHQAQVRYAQVRQARWLMAASVRCYIPATTAQLRELQGSQRVPVEWPRVYATDESEESEYAALMTAAELSADLIERPGRRVVIVTNQAVAGESIPLREVAAIHIDVVEDADPDDDLAWYATQELSDLVADVG